jgi:hypothetical protein
MPTAAAVATTAVLKAPAVRALVVRRRMIERLPGARGAG